VVVESFFYLRFPSTNVGKLTRCVSVRIGHDLDLDLNSPTTND
jgi:hypothetical protein